MSSEVARDASKALSAATRIKSPLISHVSLGVQSYTRSRQFYNAVLATIGGVCVFENPKKGCLGYGPGYNREIESLNLFERPGSSTATGEGFHLAFNAPDRKSVREFWEVAMANGGQDEGKWGLRKHYGELYYAAFVRDPDGHKLEVLFQEDDIGDDENQLKEEQNNDSSL